jgi:hypothetical protein
MGRHDNFAGLNAIGAIRTSKREVKRIRRRRRGQANV